MWSGFDTPLLEHSVPAPDRVVVAQEKLGDFLTALASIKKHQGVGAPRHAAEHRAVARQRDQGLSIFFAEKPPRITRRSESRQHQDAAIFPGSSASRCD